MPTIVVDTRERTPWEFTHRVVRRTLKVGDYSVLGYTGTLRIERKSFGDFVSCLTSQWKRFLKQVNALCAYEFSAVIVEGDLGMLRFHQYRHLLQEQAALESIAEVTAVFGMPVLLCGSRYGAQVAATRFIEKAIER